LDKVLKFAVILGWDDLKKVSDACSARVEYQCKPGTSVDYLNIWSVNAESKQQMVCDYWTWTSPAHPSGVRFSNRFHSDQLGQALDFILMNRGQFTRRVDASRDGLALKGAVTEADDLVSSLMKTRGYPICDFDQRAADISVDHPRVVENYRSAHEIAMRVGKDEATTEDLRTAMIHYRSLFEELVQIPTTVKERAVAQWLN
jgi:hypothetical protein